MFMTRQTIRAKELIRWLFSIGGQHVVSVSEKHSLRKVRDDPDLDVIWQRGTWLTPIPCIEIIPGAKATRCHELASQHYVSRSKHDHIYLMTGYALSKDGIWRSHSWTMLQSLATIFEPTPEKRLQYYGAVLTTEEARIFVEENS